MFTRTEILVSRCLASNLETISVTASADVLRAGFWIWRSLGIVMKATLKVSILLNLVLVGGMIYLLVGRQMDKTASGPVLSESKPLVQGAANPVTSPPSATESKSFEWSRLTSAKDYRLYVANLRAIGCPESTIEDIVRGDTDRAFSWERSQLSLDGSGTGPWSQARETQLVASLLGGQPGETTTLTQGAGNPMGANSGGEVVQTPEPSQSSGAGAPRYPLFLQNVNWSALGFTADQQAAIAQVRQQFQNEFSGASQSSGDTANRNAGTASSSDAPSHPDPSSTAALTQWQMASQNAANQLQTLLGAQGYAAYEQQQYYAWYQPQVMAGAGDGNLTINPEAFSLK